MSTPSISEEDISRAQIYRLTAGFLSSPPDKSNLQMASSLVGDAGKFGASINNFAKIAGQTTAEAANDEFHDLFVGVTRGELLPFGSYYQAGFLNEKPLARLRAEMARMGIERVQQQNEPEDHISSVFEIMAGLIEGTYGAPLSLADQKKFFENHINSWAGHFFIDLEGAKKSVLYAPLGTIGRLFMEIEQQAFEMN
ncbi:MAG: molecular chaperone TorD family protein [Hyphomicrobiales bacterium]|nr:molecular chaperone TorD family protein [Hyphomicrobiales bacterium]